MKRPLALLLFVPFLLPLSASAWTRASDAKIAQKAAEMGPPDLRILIARYQDVYNAGLQKAEADEGTDIHRYFVLSRQGKLRDRIERDTNGIAKMVRTNRPMSEVVERLGVLAHLVADANNPFHVANDDPRLDVAENDFQQYFERRLSRFPTVFYGIEPSFQLSTLLDRTFARTSGYYPLMSSEYFRDGLERSSADFDDRSTAFGVASVCYSHAITDLANIYYFIWKEAGGDVRRKPSLGGGTFTRQ